VKRYRFRLEQVLRVRRVQADQAAGALGVARRAEAGAVAAERDRLHAVTERSRPAGSYPAGRLLAERAVWDAEVDSLHRLAAARAAAGLVTDERRDVWTAASRRVKALELLDDRRREEHRIESDRAEARRVDDLVASRFVRTGPGGHG
jgi:flagellar biosynthesis chaperone FliJ